MIEFLAARFVCLAGLPVFADDVTEVVLTVMGDEADEGFDIGGERGN